MATAFKYPIVRTTPARPLAPGIILMALVLAVTFLALVLNSDLTDEFPYLYLLPWILALAAVFLIPSVILYYQGKLTLYNPLVFATWSYFFPAFVVGGLMLTSGWSQPFFLSFIQDAEYNLPYTIVLIMVGFGTLALGYFSSLGFKAGILIERYLPSRDYQASAMVVPGICLLLLGIFNSIGALILGVIGYQRAVAFESYDGLVFLTTLFWMQGTFLLWYTIFKQRTLNIQTFVIMVLLFTASIIKALYSGNRAGLLQAFIVVILAFLLSGRRFNFTKSVVAGAILAVCLIAGMIYGTTFRNVKGSESQVSIDEYTTNILDTVDKVGSSDARNAMELGFLSLAERIDTLSSVAVVVSSYEQLFPYEESYGLDNNIWKDISTFFIPRVLWKEKPVASEPHKYSDLYFNYADNSFAITPIGDLLRNYGPIGVPIGMFIFGIILRMIYRALIEDQPKLVSRVTLYFMLLLAISYESFYGSLVPVLFKIGITSLLGILIVNIIAKSMGYRKTAAAN